MSIEDDLAFVINSVDCTLEWAMSKIAVEMYPVSQKVRYAVGSVPDLFGRVTLRIKKVRE